MARRAVKDGADLLLLWGGDGTVQRCIDALAGSNVTIAVLPAGTANLLASNLGIPMDLPGALEVALDGVRRPLDVGVLNGERFAVMAGAGFDAALMQATDRALKDRLGRLAYVWSGARAVRFEAGEDAYRDRREALVRWPGQLPPARQFRHHHRQTHRLRRGRTRRRPSRGRGGDRQAAPSSGPGS